MWTEEQDAQLRSMAGYTASAIANVLGVTRNAVIGRAKRIGVSLTPRKSGSERLKPASSKQKPKKPGRLTAGLSPKGSLAPKPENHRERPILLDQPPLHCCSLVDLEKGMCKWPYDTDNGFVFCGSKAIGPYCHVHSMIAYTALGHRVLNRSNKDQ